MQIYNLYEHVNASALSIIHVNNVKYRTTLYTAGRSIKKYKFEHFDMKGSEEKSLKYLKYSYAAHPIINQSAIT